MLPATLSQKLKPEGREADHSSFPNSEVKNEWRYTPATPYFFMTKLRIKHMINFVYRHWKQALVNSTSGVQKKTELLK
jgi:hypothetical protein